MSNLNIPSFFPTEFATNWEAKVQEVGGKVAEYATPDPTFRGKEKSYNQIDTESDFDEITARITPTVLSEVTGGKYWLRTRVFDKAKVFDEWDDELLGTIALPDSEVITEMSKAWGRQTDDILLEELFGTRYIGATGTTSDTLPSTQKVAVDYVRSGSTANSGLTYPKILAALEIMGEAEVDFSVEGAPIMFLRMRQITDLYASVTEFRSRDFSRDIEPFNKDKLITEGMIYWNGIQIRKSQRVPLITPAATDVYAVPMFVKSALKYTLQTDAPLIDIRADLRHALQIRCKGRIGAVRTQNEKVVEIAVDESP